MDLFAQSAKKRHVGQPLAERMRPRNLGELVGQSHLVGPGRILSNNATPVRAGFESFRIGTKMDPLSGSGRIDEG